jgi:hypothetical protein
MLHTSTYWQTQDNALTGIGTIGKKKSQYGHQMSMPVLVLDMLGTITGITCSVPVLADTRQCLYWYWHDWQKKKYQYGHRMCMPVLVLDMLRTSTGISEQ